MKKRIQKTSTEVSSLLKNFRRVFLMIWKQQKFNIFLMFIVLIVSSSVGYLYSGTTALVVNNLTTGEGVTTTLLLSLGALLFVWFLRDQNEILRNYVDHQYWIQFERDVELMFIRKRRELDIARFEDPKFNDLVQRGMERSIHPMRNLFDLQMYNIGNSVSIVIAAVILLGYDPLVFLLVTLGAIPLFYVELNFAARTYGIFAAKAPIRRRFFDIRKHFMNKEGIFDIKLLGLGHKFYQIVRELFHDFIAEQLQNEKKRYFHQITAYLLSFLLAGSAIALIVLNTARGENQIGTLVFILGSLGTLKYSLDQFLQNIARQRENNMFVTDLFAILDTEPYFKRSASRELTIGTPPRIQFENVWFKYPFSSKDWVVKDLSLDIKPGEKIAFVGENGAGKSTFIKLLLGIYPPDRGRILIDGIDLQEIKLESWWRYVAVLTQDFVNYHFSAKDSIALGKDGSEEAVLEEVIKSAKGAQAHTFIQGWKKKYDEMIGVEFGGVDPSPGQKQKIAIARSLHRDPLVLILDEPTSAVDAGAEAKIFERLEEVVTDKSLVLVSHRFSTVRNADIIVVIEDGKISENGSHEELLANNKTYARLFTEQARGYS